MIDLHIHTNFSDGTDNFIDVLKKAEEKQLEYISITDHETCKVYNELAKINAKQYYTGTIIKGVELKTKVLGIGIEFLGYGVNPDIINSEVEKIYIPFEEKNIKEAYELCKVCKNIGVKLDKNILDKYDSQKYTYASSYIHEHITKEQENKKFFIYDEAWADSMAFYRLEISNPKSKFYMKEVAPLPKPDQIINLIRRAGGLVFVPHIYNYKDDAEKIFNHIIKNYNIDGFECYYSKFTKEQTQYLLDYCNNNDLYISGGSDYHGKNKPKIDLGTGMGDLNIPTKIINNWKDIVVCKN